MIRVTRPPQIFSTSLFLGILSSQTKLREGTSRISSTVFLTLHVTPVVQEATPQAPGSTSPKEMCFQNRLSHFQSDSPQENKGIDFSRIPLDRMRQESVYRELSLSILVVCGFELRVFLQGVPANSWLCPLVFCV